MKKGQGPSYEIKMMLLPFSKIIVHAFIHLKKMVITLLYNCVSNNRIIIYHLIIYHLPLTRF